MLPEPLLPVSTSELELPATLLQLPSACLQL